MRKPNRHFHRVSRTKIALSVLIVVLPLSGIAYALNSRQAARSANPTGVAASSHTRGFALRAPVPTQVIAPGETATFDIRVRSSARVRLVRRRVAMTLADQLPAGAAASFGTGTTTRSRRVRLTVRTSPSTPGGGYRLRVVARMGARGSATVPVNLVITSSAKKPVPSLQGSFSIRGDLPGLLKPDLALPLDLELTNANSTPLSISDLVVSIAGVNAPQADATHPCSAADFAVGQFSGAYGMTLPAASSRTLSELGFAESQMPQVAMLNRPVNQDGCKGSILTFAFTGSANGGSS
jgi:hypothetical protein